jgi:hypothetical protein
MDDKFQLSKKSTSKSFYIYSEDDKIKIAQILLLKRHEKRTKTDNFLVTVGLMVP